MDSQQYILGKSVSALERNIAQLFGCKEAVGVASGSDALYLSLLAMGIGVGDEVITTPFTFFATVGSILRTGATPVLADIDIKSFNIDVNAIQKCITSETKAIMPVHLYGNPCAMDEIKAVCTKHNLRLIEDAAQSFGAMYKELPAGAIGDTGCLSFFPTKNFGGAGDGGIILTSNTEIAQQARLLRVHGSEQKYIHAVLGINSRLDALQAAILNSKLPYIKTWNKERQDAAEIYINQLAGLPIQLPHADEGNEHVYHLFTITSFKRDALHEFLQQNEIGSFVYYPVPMHLQPALSHLGYKEGDFPVSEAASKTVLSLPMFPGIREEEINRVCDLIKLFFAE
jgi:dTDP-4-amino-4,6-dideoxygalactose transaminase